MMKHGMVIETNDLPEQFCGPRQFIASVPGVGFVVNDIDHPGNAGWLLTLRSMGFDL